MAYIWLYSMFYLIWYSKINLTYEKNNNSYFTYIAPS